MAITLVGEVATEADQIDEVNFTGGNYSTDDDFVQGDGSIGAKISASTLALFDSDLTNSGLDSIIMFCALFESVSRILS